MKQFQFSYKDRVSFEKELEDFKTSICSENKYSGMMFQVYSEIPEPESIIDVSGVIESIFPDVPYFGCSTAGNIADCSASETITVLGTLFELPTTRLTVRQYDLKEHSVDETAKIIVSEIKENPWIKAVEMYFTIFDSSYTNFCEKIVDIDPNINIFGGVSCSDDLSSSNCFVFTKDGGYSKSSIVIAYYGGEDFHVTSAKMTGWKQLRRVFRVTKAEGSCLKELDGIPAYEIYRKYLNIANDENFFSNTLEFPLFYERNGTSILRVPVASNTDGSITMCSDIDEGSVVRISYGDPRTVIEAIEEESKSIREFTPDVIHIFSCAARKAFWNTGEPTYELAPFKNIAPSAGFFSHGEFIRSNGYLNQHNVTLVIAAMREGDRRTAAAAEEKTLSLAKIPLVARLATFIGESSKELEESNSRLELMNEKLKAAVIIDGLTGLYNRKEIQSRIEDRLKNIKNEDFSLIMLDIDNFKQVNDTYGHQEGDKVIIALSDILRSEYIGLAGKFSAGRWGGEEFMMLLPDTKLSAAALIAELIRKYFSDTRFDNMRSQTVSIGVTQAKADDNIDKLCTRVDAALYTAKKQGKNRVITA